MKENSTKPIPYCSFVNNNVKTIRYHGQNPSCNATDFLNFLNFLTSCTLMKK